MLTLQIIREQTEMVLERLAVKHCNANDTIASILSLDDSRKSIQQELNAKQAEINALSKEIGQLFQAKKIDEANKAKEQTAVIKEAIKLLEEQMEAVSKQLQDTIISLPNLPHASVPKGRTADDNVVVKTGGIIPDSTGLAPHWELTEKYNLIDFELGNKLTGTGFPVYIGKGARLQRALISFFLDRAIQAGYVEYMPPIVVNEDSGFGTGQLPDKEGQMYYV
ncbi:MAG TPA: serine--tRNA ligase, partial [Bacteroidales bacterium]|nr:serine--tRNA ligase [Bacteroidales bacterium]